MNPEMQQFRDDAARELSSLEKPERRVRMSEFRLYSGEYKEARFWHSRSVNQKLFDEKISDIVSASQSFVDLQSRLLAENILIDNEVAGIDHGEHLVKRVSLARESGCVALVPENGGLQEKVRELVNAEGTQLSEELRNEDYANYLAHHDRGLSFSPAELERITINLPPKAYVSIDADIEKVVLLANVLPGTKTRFSCSGHGERGGLIANQREEYFTSAYLGIETTSRELIGDIQRSLENNPSVQLIIDTDASSDGLLKILIYYTKTPPPEWIIEEQKRTQEEIRRDCFSAFRETFGVEVPADISDREYDGLLHRLQEQYLHDHPEEVRHLTPNNRYIPLFMDLIPSCVEYSEYAQYALSDDAKRSRDQFLQQVETILARHRVKD